MTSVGEVTAVFVFQGARGPDGPTGELGLEGKKVRVLMGSEVIQLHYSHAVCKGLQLVQVPGSKAYK